MSSFVYFFLLFQVLVEKEQSQRSCSSFKFSSPFSSGSDFLRGHQLWQGVLCRLKVDPEKDIMNISNFYWGKFWIFIPECFFNETFYYFSVVPGSVCVSGWPWRRFATVKRSKHSKNITFRLVQVQQEWKLKNVDNYFHQVCNLIYCHIQSTDCLYAGDRIRTWITCCSWGLLYCLQKILLVRPAASLWFSNLFKWTLRSWLLNDTEDFIQIGKQVSSCVLSSWIDVNMENLANIRSGKIFMYYFSDLSLCHCF